jgi:hypothetical protein
MHPHPTGNQKLELKNMAKRQKLAPERIAFEVQQERDAAMIAAQFECEQLDQETAKQSKDEDHPLNQLTLNPKRELHLARARIEQDTLAGIEHARQQLDRLRQVTAQGLKRDREQLDSEMFDMGPPAPRKFRPQPAASQQPGSKMGMIQVAPGRKNAPARGNIPWQPVVWDRVPRSSASSSSSSWQPQQPRAAPGNHWNHNQWQQKGKATTSASRAKAHWRVGAQ